jgi:hypothetical protein
MKVKVDRPAEWQIICYYRTKFEFDPFKNTPKIRLLLVFWLGPILTLTLTLIIWWLLSTRYLYILTMMIFIWKTKKLEFWGKFSLYVMTSPNNVITSRFYLVWKALIKCFHFRYCTIWFHRFQNLTLE